MVSYNIRLAFGANVQLVLILIVVDNGLVHAGMILKKKISDCLNPYCSGQWSRTSNCATGEVIDLTVLILIVVDNGLVLNHSAMSASQVES